MAFSLLANSNPEVDENQEMELMIGSLSFYGRTFGFDSSFGSGKIRSIDKQNQDNHSVLIIRGLFQLGKFAGQSRNNRKYAKET
jgi:hypothetical protein